MTHRRRLSTFGTFIVGIVVLLAASGGTALAQSIHPKALQEMQAIIAEKMSRTPAQQKLESHLHLAGQAARGAVTTAAIPSLMNVISAVEVDEFDNVLVDIHATVTQSVLAEIAALGGTVESSFPNLDAIRAWMPLLALETLAAHPDVRFIEQAAQAMTNTRPINTKALVSHNVNQALTAGITGSGIKVGVMSDGVKSLATLQAAGNLPAVTVLPGQAGPADSDEGTAMLEIVYDVAPGAQLLYATAFNGPASFATNIQALAAAGARIIVDDVTYFNEGVFQDDTIAQAVNTVTAGGVLYLSSAGNSGNLDSGQSGTWEGDFLDSGTSIPVITGAEGAGARIHAFDATHNYNQITAAACGSPPCSPIFLKWADPLGGSSNDYDLFVLNNSLTSIVSFSNSFQTGTQNPSENVPGPAAGNRIVVVLFSGAPRALSVVTNRARLAIGTSGAIFGHNAAATALTVAATPAQNSVFTAGSQFPETYSSDGPRKIFFQPNGSAITPGNFLFGTGGGTTLSKVDLTAADCGQGAVSGFNPFCGTSAAAPVAGALAALIWSRDLSLPAPQVAALLKNTAIPAHAGFGPRTVGVGIVMAPLAGNTADAFVTRLYQLVLGRPPDAPGLAYWISQINQYRSVAIVVTAFFHSPEFLNRNLSNTDFITVLYRTFLNREPDPPGLASFLNDLATGCRTRDDIINVFIDSVEFRNLASFLPPADPISEFVTNAYVFILGRAPDAPGHAFWVSQLNQTHSVLALINGFLGSPEFLGRNTTNGQFVSVLYESMLGRAPDCAGLAGWVNGLNTGVNTRAQLVVLFAASPEFAAIQIRLFPPDSAVAAGSRR